MDKKLLQIFNLDNSDPTNNKTFDPSINLNPALYCSFVEVMQQECFERSILELWDFNETKIEQLTKTDILSVINSLMTELVQLKSPKM